VRGSMSKRVLMRTVCLESLGKPCHVSVSLTAIAMRVSHRALLTAVGVRGRIVRIHYRRQPVFEHGRARVEQRAAPSRGDEANTLHWSRVPLTATHQPVSFGFSSQMLSSATATVSAQPVRRSGRHASEAAARVGKAAQVAIQDEQDARRSAGQTTHDAVS
jgi:hypothetical protein